MTRKNKEASAGQFEELYGLTSETARIEFNPDVQLFGVWLADDLIGSGETEAAAMDDAINTARGWS